MFFIFILKRSEFVGKKRWIILNWNHLNLMSFVQPSDGVLISRSSHLFPGRRRCFFAKLTTILVQFQASKMPKTSELPGASPLDPYQSFTPAPHAQFKRKPFFAIQQCETESWTPLCAIMEPGRLCIVF